MSTHRQIQIVRSFPPLAPLLLLVACGHVWSPAGSGPTERTRTIEVTNRYRIEVDLYPALSETTIWKRIARVPPGKTVRVRVPAAYFSRDFQVVVCRVSGVLGEANCVRTGRYMRNDPIPRLVVFPSEHLHAELFG